MRVFVTGTGRCGTQTFSKACKHISNFTSGHETRTKVAVLNYPDDHIEVDPHLLWRMRDVIKKYPDAKWVFVHRDAAKTMASMARRPSMSIWGHFAFMNRGISPEAAARSIYSSTMDIMSYYRDELKPLEVYTPVTDSKWAEFVAYIGAVGNMGAAKAELKRKHNASRR